MNEKNLTETRDKLIELGKEQDPGYLFPVVIPEAGDFALSNPYAFTIATCLDRGTKSEIIWTIPYDIKQELGHLDPFIIDQMSLDELTDLFARLPRKPRYVNDAPRTVKELTRLVVHSFGGDASQFWERKSSDHVRSLFQAIFGVGPGIASMALLLIERAYGLRFNDLDRRNMDIKPDVHTTRILHRLGVASSKSEKAAIEAARKLNPSFPGAIDAGLWYMGREWCFSKNPKCAECYLNLVCVFSASSETTK